MEDGSYERKERWDMRERGKGRRERGAGRKEKQREWKNEE